MKNKKGERTHTNVRFLALYPVWKLLWVTTKNPPPATTSIALSAYITDVICTEKYIWAVLGVYIYTSFKTTIHRGPNSAVGGVNNIITTAYP